MGRMTETSAAHTLAVERGQSRTGWSSLRQPTLDWAAKHRYAKIQQYKLEVLNIFLTKHYDMSKAEKVPVIMNSLGRETAIYLYMNQNTSGVM